MNKFVYNKPKFLIHNVEFEIPTKLVGLLEKYSAKQIQAKLCIFLLKKKNHKFFSLIRRHPSYPWELRNRWW